MELNYFESIFQNKVIELFDNGALFDPSHDSTHILRVVRSAKELCEQENAKIEVILPAAYFHDFVNLPKNHPDRKLASTMSATEAIKFLKTINYPESYYEEIAHAISAHSFSAGIKPNSLEAQIIQDADRLDAIGAIGLARCLTVSGRLNRKLYSAEDPFGQSRSLDDSQFTIDHFYKKLLLLKDMMNTETGKRLANERQIILEQFLSQLQKEIP